MNTLPKVLCQKCGQTNHITKENSFVRKDKEDSGYDIFIVAFLCLCGERYESILSTKFGRGRDMPGKNGHRPINFTCEHEHTLPLGGTNAYAMEISPNLFQITNFYPHECFEGKFVNLKAASGGELK